MLKLLSFKLAGIAMLMDKVPDPAPPAPTPPAPSDWQAEKAKLEAELAALKKPKEPTPPEPDDLAKKAEAERLKKEKESGETKRLESAILFTTKAPEWLKTNANLLPSTIAGLFTQAEKENYENSVEKANAIKAGIVSEFFAIQSNLDLLTGPQKITLDDFKKLTKNDKEKRVPEIYDSIFEPTFEALKRVKKAEQLAKGGGDPSSAESAYEKKMIDLSQKHYLRERK